MENNWKEIAQDILINASNHTNKSSLDCMLEAMNLVFEATKKECSEKAKIDYVYRNPMPTVTHTRSAEICGGNIDKESILNINKPNL